MDVGLVGGLGAHRVDHDDPCAAGVCRSSARRQPPGTDSSQFQALTAGFAPTSRKKSQLSISETGTISGDPYIAWATTCMAFWSTEPTA